MTSMASESVATILCTSKQTRFNIHTPNYKELDIEGLNITVKSGAKSDGKGKARAKGEGTEILSNAKLRLQAGQRYALIGRNGTGKSTLLKAISEKLIPGIPEETRVAILQQTNVSDANTEELRESSSAGASSSDAGLNVLEEVVERATSRQEVQKEVSILNQAMESADSYGALRGLRRLRHDRLQKELFLKDKDARLRSGARGMQARKALVAKEKEVAAFDTLYQQKDENIAAEVLAQETAEAADMLAELELQIEPSRLAEIEARAKKILTGLGFSEAYMLKRVSSLSGGWNMRAALAAALLQDTDILILDEPTNFLDLLGVMWLERYLSDLAESSEPPTLLLVSHDRAFTSLCTDLLIIKDKDLTYFHGDLPMYESSRAERKVYLTKMKEAKDKQKVHIQQTIARNMREGKAKDDQNKIRQAKSRQKKLDDRWGVEVGLKGGRFKLNRDLQGYHFSARADVDIPPDEKGISFELPEPPDLRFPGSLLSLENVSFRYPSGGGKPASPLVLKDISLTVSMGDRIGILGLNGSGKSTLIKLLVGENKPTSGSVTTHPRLRLGYYSQHAVETLQKTAGAVTDVGEGGSDDGGLATTALALLTREVAGALDEGELRALLGSLGLPGRVAAETPMRALSGGQLVRLGLARILWRRPHCLVLDEATTHLDYETVAAVREALRGWEGAVVVVSHDRWFVRGVVEGAAAEGEDEGDGEDDDDYGDNRAGGGGSGVEGQRRRTVYRIRAGEMSELEGGVQQFENVMEKRVRKLMNS